MPYMVGTILPSPCILPREASLGVHKGEGSVAGGGAVTATITPPPSSSVLGREMPDRRERKVDKFGWYICRSLERQKFHYVLSEEQSSFVKQIYTNCFTLPNYFLTFNFTDDQFNFMCHIHQVNKFVQLRISLSCRVTNAC
jgi:hypothetical protein